MKDSVKKDSVWRSKLFWRLVAMNTAAVAVFLIVTSTYIEFELKRLILEDAARDLQTRAELVRAQLPPRTDPALQHTLERIASQAAARLTVIGPDGKVRADSESNPAGMDDHSLRPEVIDARKTGTGVARRFSDTRDREFLYVAIASTDDPQSDVVRVAVPMQQLLARLDVLRNALWFTNVVLLLAGVGLSFVIARSVVRPVEIVRQAARRLAGGDFAVEVALQRNDEFGQLVDAFNSMGKELQNRVGQLEANRRELATIMQNMAEGLVLVDAAGTVVLANQVAGQLLGTEHEALRGKPLWETIRLPQVDELLASLPNLTEPRRIWVEDRTHGSQRRVLAFVVTPLFDTAKGERHCVLLISDATEDQKLLELRQDFVANVSHELKTPLTSISAYVETLLDGADSDEAVRRPFLEKIQTNATRLTKLVSDILNISRLESGIGDESRQHLDLNEVAQNCIRKHAEAAAAKKLQVTLHASAEPAMALVNEEDMTEAVDNLLVNAISYTPADGRIDITVQQTELGLVLEVKDTGMGIPKDALPRVFERFYRVDKARSRALGGTGLGLAIVKHVALKHGGKVEAESEVGKGSSFRISLPAAPVAKR